MARADAIIAISNIINGGVNYVVRTPGGVLYQVFIDNAVDVVFRKSSDNGLSWSESVTVFTGTVTYLSVWYDRWSNIAAGLIHCAYTETGGHDTLYRSIDTEASDALGTQTTIFAGVSATNAGNLSITRARGGNLYCHSMIDAGAEGGFFRSVDVGANWTSRTVNETIATTDQIIMMPGWNAGDTQDAMAFFWDASANEVSRYLYDDSANTWAETSIATSMTDTTAAGTFPHFAAAVDATNSRNLLVAWSVVDAANADLRCWHVTESAITEVTNVVLNSTDDQGLCAIGIDTTTEDWYVFYGGKSDGSETWPTAIKFYYKISTDDGATWGSEQTLTAAVRNVTWMVATPRFATEFCVSFQNIAAANYLQCSAPIPTAGGVTVTSHIPALGRGLH